MNPEKFHENIVHSIDNIVDAAASAAKCMRAEQAAVRAEGEMMLLRRECLAREAERDQLLVRLHEMETAVSRTDAAAGAAEAAAKAEGEAVALRDALLAAHAERDAAVAKAAEALAEVQALTERAQAGAEEEAPSARAESAPRPPADTSTLNPVRGQVAAAPGAERAAAAEAGKALSSESSSPPPSPPLSPLNDGAEVKAGAGAAQVGEELRLARLEIVRLQEEMGGLQREMRVAGEKQAALTQALQQRDADAAALADKVAAGQAQVGQLQAALAAAESQGAAAAASGREQVERAEDAVRLVLADKAQCEQEKAELQDVVSRQAQEASELQQVLQEEIQRSVAREEAIELEREAWAQERTAMLEQAAAGQGRGGDGEEELRARAETAEKDCVALGQLLQEREDDLESLNKTLALYAQSFAHASLPPSVKGSPSSSFAPDTRARGPRRGPRARGGGVGG